MDVCTLDSAAVTRETPDGQGRARKERSDCRVTDEGLYNAIVAHFGILSYVAIAVGISRAALYKRVDRAPQLQAARDGARRVVVEVATYHLRKALSEGADWAVHFYMCRQDGIWFSMTEPREPKEPSEPGEPREPKAEEPEESEPQPERANKTMLRLIRAVERGEPWAVKYCLNHLEPNGRYARKRRGPEVVIAPPEMAEPRGFERLSPLAERAAELADAYFDALFGKRPNPFDTADQDVTRLTAPTDIPAGEPGCVSTRTRGSVENVGQRATGPRADATRLACEPFPHDAALKPVNAESAPTVDADSAPTEIPAGEPGCVSTRTGGIIEDVGQRATGPRADATRLAPGDSAHDAGLTAPTLDLAGGPSVTGAATGTGAPTVAGAPTHTKKPKPAPTLKGRRANAHDRDRTRKRKRRVRTPSKKQRARSAAG